MYTINSAAVNSLIHIAFVIRVSVSVRYMLRTRTVEPKGGKDRSDTVEQPSGKVEPTRHGCAFPPIPVKTLYYSIPVRVFSESLLQTIAVQVSTSSVVGGT